MEHTVTIARRATVVRALERVDLSTRADRPLLVDFSWTDLGLCPRTFCATSTSTGLSASMAITKVHHLHG